MESVADFQTAGKMRASRRRMSEGFDLDRLADCGGTACPLGSICARLPLAIWYLTQTRSKDVSGKHPATDGN